MTVTHTTRPASSDEIAAGLNHLTEAQIACLFWHQGKRHVDGQGRVTRGDEGWGEREFQALLHIDFLEVGPGGWHVPSEAALLAMAVPARMLADGRCCGRKPLVYKRDGHHFCTRCCRSYSLQTSAQMTNWAWKPVECGFVATYPKIGGVQ